MAEMHRTMASGDKVSAEYKKNELHWFKQRWQHIRRNKHVGHKQVAEIEAQLDALYKDFMNAEVDATVAHGDAHAGNFSVADKGNKVGVIDVETMFRSIGKDGKGIGSGAIDVGRFMESLRTFGTEMGLMPAEIAQIQQDYYRAYRTLRRGDAKTADFEVATKFYRANMDTIAVAGALRGGDLKIALRNLQSLRATLGLSSKYLVTPDMLKLGTPRSQFEQWMISVRLSTDDDKNKKLRGKLFDLYGRNPKAAVELAKKRYNYPN